MKLKKSLAFVVLLTLVLNFHHASAFFSDDGLFSSLKESMEKAQSFLVNDMLPLLAEGLRAAQKAEEFLDATIGEDCQFECRAGLVPVPNPDHKPTSNGCGSLDVLFDDSEESLIHVEQEFTECCNTHDICYDVCGADKEECDLKFKRCLYAICKTKKQTGFLDSKTCKLKAKLFYMTVVGVGCQSYLDAQKTACVCVRNSNNDADSNRRYRNEL